jgi:TonB family protein
MVERRAVALLLLVVVQFTSTAPAVGEQRPASPPPAGHRIVARDGDVIVVEDDARVRIVRRRQASVRVVFNAAERWLLLLVDHAGPGISADGRVDTTYYYREVNGAWPFATPWEGLATIEEYSMAAPGTTGIGIDTPSGLVQQLRSQQESRDADAVAVLTFRNGGHTGTIGKLTFDDAERWYSAELRRNDGVMRSPSGIVGSVSSGIEGGTRSGGDPAAIRVGGNIRPPVKVVDVPPVKPEVAERANVRGIVIIEVTIALDGTVEHARVLRSIPLLDAAAIEAVRQWRFEPTTLGGRAVPVIMTVSVGF